MIKGTNLNRKILLELLSDGFCKVQFRKATNGRYRSMYCTLNSKNIPGKYQKSVLKTLEGGEDPNLLPVFDVVNRDWRSFYIDNIMYLYTEKELRGEKTKKSKKKE